jgi:hypothetical protein
MTTPTGPYLDHQITRTIRLTLSSIARLSPGEAQTILDEVSVRHAQQPYTSPTFPQIIIALSRQSMRKERTPKTVAKRNKVSPPTAP